MKQKLINLRMILGLIALTSFFSCEKENVSIDTVDKDINSEIEREYFFKIEDSLNVSSSDATSAALYIVNNGLLGNSKYEAKGATIQTEIDEIITVPDENDEPAMYVINYINGGFVVLSATEKEDPVLAYSEKNHFSFENNNAGIFGWFHKRMNKIQTIRNDAEYEIPVEYRAKWQKVKGISYESTTNNRSAKSLESNESTIEEYGPLLTTTWGQGLYYNDQLDDVLGYSCNTFSNGNPPVGCVATAMAQVVNYHGKGSYDFANMPNSLNAYSTPEQVEAVSWLMKDLGDQLNMDYNCNGSAAFTKDINDILENHDALNYTNGGTYVNEIVGYRALPAITTDIIASKPVIIRGCNTKNTERWLFWEYEEYSDCHAWVCDGYKYFNETISLPILELVGPLPTPTGQYQDVEITNHYFHMNWGWNGSYMGSSDNNGWYKLGNFEISNGDNYTYDEGYLTGMTP